VCDGDGERIKGLSRRRFLAASAVAAGLAPLGRAAMATALPVEPVPGLAIQPRAAWAGNLAPTGPIGTDELRFLLVHHTASTNGYDADGVAGILRGIYRFHTGAEKGWPDVCYHFFVDRYGGIWEGRAGSLDGAVAADATGGNQGYAQLACLVGDFTTAVPTDAMVDALVRLLAWSAGRWAIDTTPGTTITFTSRGSNRWPAGANVTTTTIAGHRDMSYTACPGDRVYEIVRGDLPARVHEAAGAGAAVLTGDVSRWPGPAVEALPSRTRWVTAQ
jgi:N-acetylmuramoyl-L-alanine amidase